MVTQPPPGEVIPCGAEQRSVIVVAVDLCLSEIYLGVKIRQIDIDICVRHRKDGVIVFVIVVRVKGEVVAEACGPAVHLVKHPVLDLVEPLGLGLFGDLVRPDLVSHCY